MQRVFLEGGMVERVGWWRWLFRVGWRKWLFVGLDGGDGCLVEMSV